MQNEIVTLRALEPSDLDFIYNLENDIDNFEFGNSSISSISKYTLSQYIENAHQNIVEAGQYRWVIVEKSSNKSIGIVDLYEYDGINQRAGVGIIVNKQYREKGFASSVMELLIKYSESTLNLNSLFCQIEVGNNKSEELFLKFNFEKTGEFKQWNIRGSKKYNVNFYQLILPQ